MKQLVPRRRRIAASLIAAAFAAGLAHAQTTSKAGAIVAFEADLGHASAVAHAPFKAGGASWSCSTTHCTGKGPGNNPAATCASLVVQVGTLKTFTAAGKSVDVKACNGVPPAMSAAPVARPMVAAPTTAVAAQGAKTSPAAAHAPIKTAVIAPTAPKPGMPIVVATAPLSFSGVAAGPVRITTAALSFTGPHPGGVLVATAGLSFVGGRTKGIATPMITFVGTNVAPRTIATDPISFSGRPPR